MQIDSLSTCTSRQSIDITIKAGAATEKKQSEETDTKKDKVKDRNSDKVIISDEARDFQEQMNQIRESGNAQAEEMEKKSKCMIIAGRVAAGDNVSAKDLQYLMKNEPEMYAQAMKLRIPKDNPKKWDSISEDEDESDETGATSTVNLENISIAMPQGESPVGVSVK